LDEKKNGDSLLASFMLVHLLYIKAFESFLEGFFYVSC